MTVPYFPISRMHALEGSHRARLFRFGGHFLQTPTHYTIRGTWQLTIFRGSKPPGSVKGTWWVKKRKP